LVVAFAESDRQIAETGNSAGSGWGRQGNGLPEKRNGTFEVGGIARPLDGVCATLRFSLESS